MKIISNVSTFFSSPIKKILMKKSLKLTVQAEGKQITETTFTEQLVCVKTDLEKHKNRFLGR
jgi:hypothetical protein